MSWGEKKISFKKSSLLPDPLLDVTRTIRRGLKAKKNNKQKEKKKIEQEKEEIEGSLECQAVHCHIFL